MRRLAHVAAGQRHDRTGHGGREQHHLPAGGREGQDLLDVGQEAQVEHLVGLVQDHDAGVREVEVSLLGEVEQATGGADHDLDAALQLLDLGLERAPAVDRRDAHAALPSGPLEVAGDLHRELTGGGHGQGLRLARVAQLGEALVGGGDHAVEHRDAEAEGLAGAGLGLADDVVTAQGDREGHGLDGEGVLDPERGQRRDDVRVDVEVGEGQLGGDLGRLGAGLLVDGGVEGGVGHAGVLSGVVSRRGLQPRGGRRPLTRLTG